MKTDAQAYRDPILGHVVVSQSKKGAQEQTLYLQTQTECVTK